MIEGQGLRGACSPEIWNENHLMVKRMIDLFYADETDQPEDVALAKSICTNCPVVDDCLSLNIDEQYGIWGNTTERERRILRREMRNR